MVYFLFVALSCNTNVQPRTPCSHYSCRMSNEALLLDRWFQKNVNTLPHLEGGRRAPRAAAAGVRPAVLAEELLHAFALVPRLDRILAVPGSPVFNCILDQLTGRTMLNESWSVHPEQWWRKMHSAGMESS